MNGYTPEEILDKFRCLALQAYKFANGKPIKEQWAEWEVVAEGLLNLQFTFLREESKTISFVCISLISTVVLGEDSVKTEWKIRRVEYKDKIEGKGETLYNYSNTELEVLQEFSPFDFIQGPNQGTVAIVLPANCTEPEIRVNGAIRSNETNLNYFCFRALEELNDALDQAEIEIARWAAKNCVSEEAIV